MTLVLVSGTMLQLGGCALDSATIANLTASLFSTAVSAILSANTSTGTNTTTVP